ncbi:hypothetical protein ABLE68_13620 [Nocardioides sp. CN2-186]|uniref:hypothetical protein n=1 Tax=Nocardioides tweenelious TaxID=3156607 RepID=UPI0032B57643
MERSRRHRALLVGGVVVVSLLGSLGAITALWDASVVLNVVVAGAFATGAGLLAAAFDANDDRDRVWLIGGCAAAMLAAFLATGYELARPDPEPVEMVAVGRGPTVQPVGEPGGRMAVSNVLTGTTVKVSCVVRLDGDIWYRLAWINPAAWLPDSALRPPRGQDVLDVPECG